MRGLGIDAVMYILDTFFVCQAVPDTIASQNNEFIFLPNSSAELDFRLVSHASNELLVLEWRSDSP